MGELKGEVEKGGSTRRRVNGGGGGDGVRVTEEQGGARHPLN